MGGAIGLKTSLLEILACVHCKGALEVRGGTASIDHGPIESGELGCKGCGAGYPVSKGIARFVEERNYAASFGFQWNRFSRTQLDSYSGTRISSKRLLLSTGWDWSRMKGKRVLDVGCGAGRFAEVALEHGATVVGVDYSVAIDAARKNLSRFEQFEGIQASIYDLPFKPGSFDYVYCLGVLQHTPDPDRAFAMLPLQLAPGGAVAIDVYPWLWTNIGWSKYWLRPFTKKIPSEKLFELVERAVPSLLAVSRRVSSIPRVGKKLKYLLPVANYDGVHELSEAQIREWAVLDTFDMLSPEHDHPRSARTVRQWLEAANLVDIEVIRAGHVIGRGRKPIEGVPPQLSRRPS
jgi:SAM-dependent methyltransferase